MYGPTWPFLLMYGSHDMRHAGFRRFPQVDGGQRDPRKLGRHIRITRINTHIGDKNGAPCKSLPKWKKLT